MGTTWGLIRADRALKAEARRAEGERKANAQAQKRLQQIEKGSEILASVFRDLDPRAEEKEGRPLRVILGDRLDQAAAALEGDAVGDPLVVANLQDRLGRTYRSLGNPAKARSLLTKAIAIRRSQLGPDHFDTLASMSRLAMALKDLGEYRESIAVLEQVRDAQNRQPQLDPRFLLGTLDDLAVLYWLVGRSIEACALLEHVRDALLKEKGPYHVQTIDALDSLSGVYMTLGKQAEAVTLAEQVHDARVKIHGADHPIALAALNNLARRYDAVGKMTKALALYEEARNSAIPKLGATIRRLSSSSTIWPGCTGPTAGFPRRSPSPSRCATLASPPWVLFIPRQSTHSTTSASHTRPLVKTTKP